MGRDVVDDDEAAWAGLAELASAALSARTRLQNSVTGRYHDVA